MIYDEPRFLPGGDTFVLVQFGDDARIDLNFMALGLTAALHEDRTAGVIDTNPSYNSVVVEYDPDRIGLDDLERELRRLIEGLGSVEDLELESRLAYLPVMYRDPWTKACVEDYAQRIAPRDGDPEFVARINGLEDSSQLVRVSIPGPSIGWSPSAPRRACR